MEQVVNLVLVKTKAQKLQTWSWFRDFRSEPFFFYVVIKPLQRWSWSILIAIWWWSWGFMESLAQLQIICVKTITKTFFSKYRATFWHSFLSYCVWISFGRASALIVKVHCWLYACANGALMLISSQDLFFPVNSRGWVFKRFHYGA